MKAQWENSYENQIFQKWIWEGDSSWTQALFKPNQARGDHKTQVVSGPAGMDARSGGADQEVIGADQGRSLEGTAVGGGAGSQLSKRNLLWTHMRHLWHFQVWSWELYREPGVWLGKRAGDRVTERVTVQYSIFQETILYPFSQISSQREQSAWQVASWRPPERGHVASPCLDKVQGSLHGQYLSFLLSLDSL